MGILKGIMCLIAFIAIIAGGMWGIYEWQEYKEVKKLEKLSNDPQWYKKNKMTNGLHLQIMPDENAHRERKIYQLGPPKVNIFLKGNMYNEGNKSLENVRISVYVMNHKPGTGKHDLGPFKPGETRTFSKKLFSIEQKFGVSSLDLNYDINITEITLKES